MKSPVYWSVGSHEILKKILRRKKTVDIHKRLQEVQDWIPDNSNVLDIGAGTARIYREFLKGKVNYQAMEINPAFVKYLKNEGIKVIQQTDIRKDPIPTVDIIIMMAVLYHFEGVEGEIVEKLVSSARHRVIIVEPLGEPLSNNSWKGKLKAKLADIGEGPIYNRLNRDRLMRACEDKSEIEYSSSLPNNEFIVVLKGLSK